MSYEKPPIPMEEMLQRMIRYQIENPDENLPGAGLFARLLSCDEEHLTVELAYETKHWMKNPMGVLHGGITAALLDTAMGMAVCSQCGFPAPTINININYVRPVPLETTVAVRAHVVTCGSSIAYTTGEIFLPEQPDCALASASGVYSLKTPTKLYW